MSSGVSRLTVRIVAVCGALAIVASVGWAVIVEVGFSFDALNPLPGQTYGVNQSIPFEIWHRERLIRDSPVPAQESVVVKFKNGWNNNGSHLVSSYET